MKKYLTGPLVISIIILLPFTLLSPLFTTTSGYGTDQEQGDYLPLIILIIVLPSLISFIVYKLSKRKV